MALYRAQKFYHPGVLFGIVVVLTGVEIAIDLALAGVHGLWLMESRQFGESPRPFVGRYELQHLKIMLTATQSIWIYLSFIPFLKLMGRFCHNAWSFGATGMKYTPGWTIAWFLIPLANLFFPFLSIQESWRVSLRGEGRWQERSPNLIVTLWWLSTITLIFLALGAGSVAAAATINLSTELFFVAGILELVVLVVNATSSVFLLLAIRQLAAIQRDRQQSGERYDRLAESCPGCGEPITVRLGNCPLCGHPLEIIPQFPAHGVTSEGFDPPMIDLGRN